MSDRERAPYISLVRRIGSSFRFPNDHGDGFPEYLAQAKRESKDVNDWIEEHLGWLPARPILESLVFPYLRHDSTVCEVGVGTGRWSRHIVERIPEGRLILIDQSRWVVSFLRDYFKSNNRVMARVGDGESLPVAQREWADVIFSQGMFITLKLGHLMRYMDAFSDSLVRGGVTIFDFIDAETPGGWQFLRREYQSAPTTFSYHTHESVVKCCSAAGLTVEGTSIVGKSTYIIARKRDS